MTTKKYFIGNWKMDPDSLEKALTVFSDINAGIKKHTRATVIVCPSFVHIAQLASLPKRKILLGAQNMFVESKGSYTGEVSASMLKDAGVEFVILGHSDRRKLGETDVIINKKVLLALKVGLTPIICVGENFRDEEGLYLASIKDQLEKTLAGVSKRELGKVIIAYEPVWAVGGAEAMSARDIHEMKIFVKKTLVDLYKLKTSFVTPIVYGGAVDPANARGILKDGEVDGVLVGRQSLEAKNFLEIIKSI